MIVFVDLETGGSLPSHPIIQIAAVVFRDPRSDVEVATFERKLLFDVRSAEPEALRLNHYAADVWAKEAKDKGAAAIDFKAFLDKHSDVELRSKRTGNPYIVARVGGHNVVAFDLDRLGRLFRALNLFLPVQYNSALDTLQGSVWKFERNPPPPEDYELSTIAAHFGIETPKAHDALADCRTSAAIARRLLA